VIRAPRRPLLGAAAERDNAGRRRDPIIVVREGKGGVPRNAKTPAAVATGR
jgi:hypothetical protein